MRTSALLLILMSAFTARAAEKPNIVVIYADDMGYGDCTVNNPQSKIPTPHIDQLAREGIRFTDAHSPSSTCTASRYGLLTGVNPARTGVVNGLTGLGPVIDGDEVTVADFLKDQGYITSMVGKWHLGFELHGDGPRKTFDFSKRLIGGPLDCGFDYFFGVRMAIGSPPYFYIRGREPVANPTELTPGTTTALKTNGKDSRTAYPPGDIAPGFVPEQCNAKFCDDVIRIIKEHAASGESKPLFLYYAMLEPHTPWLPTGQYIGKSKAGPYGDYIVQLDHEVGRVLEALKESGLDENTLVIFSSDNGAMWRSADIEQFGHRANGIFSGTKGTGWEGGHRVPFIARWPGHVPASAVSRAVINHTDLFATLADLFNVDLAQAYPGSAQDSFSFLSVLDDPAKEHQRPGMAVTPASYRMGDWKLRFTRRGASLVGRSATDAVLHNLSEDPAEEQDLSDTQSEMKNRLFEEYQQFVAERKLKPLAVQVIENKSQKKKRSPNPKKTASPPGGNQNGKRPNPAPGALQVPDDVQLSEEQKTKVEVLVVEYRRKIAELQKQLANVLTDEQEKQMQNLRQAMANVTREFREKLLEVLTDEQKAKLTEQ